MAHLLVSEEGHTTGQNEDDTYECGTATAQWLDKNNLGHLKSVFGKENITIEEILNMKDNEQIEFIDLLADDSNVAFNKRDAMRFKSKLKSEMNQNKPSSETQPSPIQYQQVIVTEAEQTALKSLADKFEQLQQEQKEIEEIITNLEKEHVKQQKVVNGTFDEIISQIGKRRNILLNNMNEMIQQYKSQLNKTREQNANFRNELLKVQKEYDTNLKQSAQSTSSAMSVGFVNIQQRANVNIKLIDEVLLQIQQSNHEKSKVNATEIMFNIDKTQIMQDINLWGDVKLKGAGVSYCVPTVMLLWKKNYSTAVIEILLNHNANIKVNKYQIEVYNGNMDDEKDVENIMKPNEIVQVDVLDDNIALYRIEGLESGGKKYSVRVKAIIDEDDDCHTDYSKNYSKWLSFETSKPMKAKKRRKANKAIYTFWKTNFERNGSNISYNEWLSITQKLNFGLNEYERKRIYYGLNYPQPHGTMTMHRFESFVVSGGNNLYQSNTDWIQFHTKCRQTILG